ncbi:hypothetical protein BDN72DRAFT_855932 [Pluteus cervinus]|uniref:Uncharacterized protein n=1 Tax=Pluteus cervinus TaxID=181527 RepID=A0ACD3B1S7_9AGAR|nr:hypothetical protein BDN72DRAFT_855932 [Pluteus cervinus]
MANLTNPTSSFEASSTQGAQALILSYANEPLKEGFPKGHMITKHDYYVNLIVDDTNCVTTVAKPAVWNEEFTIPFRAGSRLEIQLYCYHKGEPGHLLGKVIDSTLLGKLAESVGDIEAPLSSGGTITYRVDYAPVKRLATSREISNSSWNAVQQMDNIGLITQVVLERGPRCLSPNWAILIHSLGGLIEATQNFGDLNGAAKIALGAVCIALHLVIDQVELDMRVEDLLENVVSVYRYLQETNFAKVDAFEQTIKSLVKETTECVYFISTYQQKAFISKAFDSTVLGVVRIVEDFEVRLARLKIEFVMGTALSVHRTALMILDLARRNGATWRHAQAPLTRASQRILDNLTRWAQSDDAYTISVLVGGADSQKSAIAHFLAKQFAWQDWLGSGVFFSGESGYSCHNLVTTIVREIAALNDTFAEKITRALDKFPLLSSAPSDRRFEDLFLAPLRSLNTATPILVIIDGLDKCDDQSKFMDELIRHCHEIPTNVRILLTLEPSADILRPLTRAKPLYVQVLHPHPNLQRPLLIVSHYILVWLSQQYKELIPVARIDRLDGVFSQLTNLDRCFGLKIFNWYMFGSPEELAQLLSSGIASGEIYATLAALPDPLLPLAYHYVPENTTSRFKSVISFAATLAPPSRTSFHDVLLTTKVLDPEAANLAITMFGYTYEQCRTKSLSFGEFLHVDKFESHVIAGSPEIATLSLRYLNRSLKSNLLHFPDITSSNFELPDLDANLLTFVPPVMKHLTRSWTSYLVNMSAKCTHFEWVAVLEELSEFLHNHLFDWLELLSLLSYVDEELNNSLLSFANWLTVQDLGAGGNWMPEIVQDFLRLIQLCRSYIKLNGLSVHRLPSITPAKTTIYRIYGTKGLMVSGIPTTWPPYKFLLEHSYGPSTKVEIASFHGVSTLATSCSSVKLWNIRSGDLIKEVWPENVDSTKIAISPCGDRFAFIGLSRSTSRKSCIVEDGQLAVGLKDGSIYLWNSSDLSHWCFGICGAGAITALAFSPDGTRLASASGHWGVWIWEVGAKERMETTLRYVETPETGAASLIWSPNQRYIAVPADDNCSVWEPATGKSILSHKTAKNAGVAFTMDGAAIILPIESEQALVFYDLAQKRAIRRIPLFKPTGEPLFLTTISLDHRQFLAYSFNKAIYCFDLAPEDPAYNDSDVIGHYQSSPKVETPKSGTLRIRRPTLPQATAYAPKVSENGWICTAKGRRILWVPWPFRGEITLGPGVDLSRIMVTNVRGGEDLVLDRSVLEGLLKTWESV